MTRLLKPGFYEDCEQEGAAGYAMRSVDEGGDLVWLALPNGMILWQATYCLIAWLAGNAFSILWLSKRGNSQFSSMLDG